LCNHATDHILNTPTLPCTHNGAMRCRRACTTEIASAPWKSVATSRPQPLAHLLLVTGAQVTIAAHGWKTRTASGAVRGVALACRFVRSFVGVAGPWTLRSGGTSISLASNQRTHTCPGRQFHATCLDVLAAPAWSFAPTRAVDTGP
jgi:hypothetical protein